MKVDKRVSEIRRVLDALARAENKDNDTKEIIYDRELSKIREMDRSGILDLVKQAIGNNAKRSRFAHFVFSELYEVRGIEDVFMETLENSDPDGRADIIQTIGLRKMRNLVGVLNDHFTKETDDFCRGCLLHTLGRLADTSSLPIFTYLISKNDRRDEWPLLVAARNFARPEFEEYLLKIFDNADSKKSHRVMAGWGLAKLGNSEGHRFLIEMLDDPEISTANFYDPGESLRAAEALADIHGWDFEWDKSSVPLIKQKIAEIDDRLTC